MLTATLIFLIFFFLFTTYVLHEKTKEYTEEIDELKTKLLRDNKELYRCQEKLKEKN
jgi:hypothetical protein